MKIEHIENMHPIKTVDNKYGVVIRFGDDEVGVQVPGEDDIRWIPLSNITESGAALIETIAKGDRE